MLQTPVAAAAGAAWNEPARGMWGRMRRGGLGGGYGGDWMREWAGRGGRGAVGRAWSGSRRAAAAQSGAGQHGAEVGQKREGEEVRWGGCDALLVRAAGGLKKVRNGCFAFLL